MAWILGAVGGATAVGGVGVIVERKEWAGPGAIAVAVGGLVLITAVVLGTGKIELTEPRRLAIGVGGLAVMALVFGITQYDSVKAVATLPLIVLFIGIAVWPEADELFEDDLRKTIITWMGVILGATAIAVGVQVENDATGDRPPSSVWSLVRNSLSSAGHPASS